MRVCWMGQGLQRIHQFIPHEKSHTKNLIFCHFIFWFFVAVFLCRYGVVSFGVFMVLFGFVVLGCFWCLWCIFVPLCKCLHVVVSSWGCVVMWFCHYQGCFTKQSTIFEVLSSDEHWHHKEAFKVWGMVRFYDLTDPVQSGMFYKQRCQALADPGEARGCPTNTSVISLIY